MMTDELKVDAMVKLGRSMADPSRARILLHLMNQPDYPAHIARQLGLGRTNVSNHLACLRGCGIVTLHNQGRRTLYALESNSLKAALHSLLSTIPQQENYCALSNPEIQASAGPTGVDGAPNRDGIRA